MTRRVVLLAAGLAIGLLLLGFQSWSVAVERVERHVIAGIEDRIGLTVTGLERAEIAFLPLPRISLSQVSFIRQDGVLGGQAARIRARARLLPLLGGRLDFDRIDLIGPQIDLALSGPDDSVADWLATPLAFLGSLREQSRIVISAGTIFARSQGAIRTILRNVNVVMEERRADEPLLVSGAVNWRGVATDVSLRWPMSDQRGRLSLQAVSPLMDFRLEGTRSGRSEPVINGQLTISARALPEMLGWFGETPRLSAAIGQFALAAEAQITPREISLSALRAVLDGDRLDGALKLTESGGRWALAGTLAGAALDLGRLHDKLRMPGPGQAPDGATPLDFEAWTAHDLDLRVSVDSARLHGARLGEVATYLLIKKGRFEAGLLRATAYGGSVKGRLLAVTAPAGIDVRLQGAFERINLAQSAADLPDLARLTGIAGAQVTLEGVGATMEDLLASFGGKAALSLRQGELGGFAFSDLLRRAERNPALALRDWRQGKTAFETATLNATVTNGIATLTDGQIMGPAYRATLTGRASLPQRTIAFNGLLAPTQGGVALPFVLKGPFDDPTLTFEPALAPRQPVPDNPAPAMQ